MKRESGSALHIYGCLFLIVLALAGCGAALDTSDTDAASGNSSNQSAPVSRDSNTINYGSQLQLIADNTAVWMGDTELIAEPFSMLLPILTRMGGWRSFSPPAKEPDFIPIPSCGRSAQMKQR